MKIKMVLILAVLIPFQTQAFFWGKPAANVAESVQVETNKDGNIQIVLSDYAVQDGEKFLRDLGRDGQMIYYYDIGLIIQKYLEENGHLRNVLSNSRVKAFTSDFIIETPYGDEVYYQIEIEESSVSNIKAYIINASTEKYLAGTKAPNPNTQFAFNAEVERILKKYIRSEGMTLELQTSPVHFGSNQ